MKIPDEDRQRRIEKLKSYIGLVREAWKHAHGAMDIRPDPTLHEFQNRLARLDCEASKELIDLGLPPIRAAGPEK